MTYKVGEVWLANGLWEFEKPQKIRIMEIIPDSNNVDVNYNLNENGEADLRILPWQCLIKQV